MFEATKGSDFRRKIKTKEELRELIGERPRKKSVIMCHGTFDIVHPGHIRHLMYAKEKADILIASLTCDLHINKANFRPFIPERLRAMNLAAMEFVDFVVIDSNPTPLENIRFLQPDYFAKGYEYTHDGVHPKTSEEIQSLESYGGEIIFTPGDVVFSSSSFIESSPPRIQVEKLAILMNEEKVTFEDLRSALNHFENLKIHVVGDTIVDSYTYTTVIGGMTKTPTFSVKYDKQVDFVGGAGIVSKHIQKAGAKVKFTTVLGNDALKDLVIDDLAKAGIEVDAMIDRTRPTTQKNAIIAGGYRLLKLDKVDNRTISDRILERMKTAIKKSSDVDAIVFSDFRHGIFNRRTISELTHSIPEGPLKIADSQVASRWGNILDFQGFDLITPNEKEARFALGDQDSVVRPLALELYNRAQCKYLILKLGERGTITFRSNNPDDMRSFFTIDSFVERVVDAVGAGDALLAYSVLALLATKNPVIASILGSMAAAVACERDGNTPVSPDEVRKILDITEKRIRYT